MHRNSEPTTHAKPTQYGKRPPGWIGFHKNGMLFEFQALRIGVGYRIYILAHPSYGSLSTTNHATHRYHDRQQLIYYVCTKIPPLTFTQAKEDARAWSYYTEHYIRTGEILTA